MTRSSRGLDAMRSLVTTFRSGAGGASRRPQHRHNDRRSSKGLDLAQRFGTGIVHVNASTMGAEPSSPNGGVKDSGWGRSGHYSIEDFTEIHLTTLTHGSARCPFEQGDKTEHQNTTTGWVIDIYTHFLPPGHLEPYQALGSEPGLAKRIASIPMLYDLEARLRLVGGWEDRTLMGPARHTHDGADGGAYGATLRSLKLRPVDYFRRLYADTLCRHGG